MAGLAHRAALVSFARLCNQAISLFSPIILVRLLPVEDFGAYRSFFLYFNVVSVMALSAANWSLLYFVPRQPAAMWRIVRTCARIVAISSLTAATAIYAIDYLSGGHVIGERVDAVLIYMVLFVNLDFWEHLALARKRPLAVLGYSVGRLLARMTAVITTAAITRDVDHIILSLIAVEAIRLIASAIVWRRIADEKSEDAAAAPSAREILAQSLPLALSVLVNTVNQQSGGIIVDRLIGEVGLAYLTVGTYVSFIGSSGKSVGRFV
jgi:O-antigen/teichoic acid export membrane protein